MARNTSLTNLIVVTHRNPNNTRDITKCVDSVAVAIANLPKHITATHTFIDCFSADAVTDARVEALKLGEFICFVDDDDEITPLSLAHAMSAIIACNAGVAFTQEKMVYATKAVISDCAATYEDVILGPRIIHHLAVIRSGAVTERGIKLAKYLRIGSEWVLKADAGFNKGIVHVPEIGYYWNQHDNDQSHKQTQHKAEYLDRMRYVTKEMKAWARPRGKILQVKFN